MEDHLRPFDVSQEPVAEPVSRVRALDEPRHVGHDEAAVAAESDDSEVWCQRRERIVGNLGTGRGDPRDERRLARVGEPDEADVGQELQLEAQESFFARFTRLDAPWGAIGRGDEARVAAAATASLCDEDLLALVGEIPEQMQALVRGILFEDERPDRHLDLEVVGRPPGLVGALPVRTAPGFELGVKTEVDERVLAGSGDDVDGAAVAAVAAVRAAARDELLTSEAERTGASVA